MPVVALQCRQRFPDNAEVRLVWGKGISAASGVKTDEDQVLAFKTRPPFTATFSCDRENADADCIPILPLRLDFSSAVPWGIAKNIVLRGQGKTYRPDISTSHAGDEEGEPEDKPGTDEDFVNGVSFRGPFQEKASFIMEIPLEVKDDSGRTLSNSDKFPLTIKTDAYPPLAKFAARFGIIELKGDAALPVTLRNLEPAVRTRLFKVEEKKGATEKGKEETAGRTSGVVEGLKGSLRRLPADKEENVIRWLGRIAAAKRETPLLKNEKDKKEFQLPKPGGSKAFEVIGIPLKEPGFYVVEMESRILGSSLLGIQRPMYVQTAALVTDLSAHFLWGRESSLVWVTTLEKAAPVKDAVVTIRDCKGHLLWQGKTGSDGIARVKKTLPSESDLPVCDFHINYSEAEHSLNKIERGLFVFAKTADDMTFVHTGWDNGIEPFRYNLPEADERESVIGHTIFDRSLLRAGDTVHMKHVLRRHVSSGFAMVKKGALPEAVLIQHQGSEQRYEFPLRWDAKGTAETTWQIPAEAKLGSYSVVLLKKKSVPSKKGTTAGGHAEGEEEYAQSEGWDSGSFRVEEFRVPLMKGLIQARNVPLVNTSELELDLLVSHLSGGGANGLPIRLRSRIEAKNVSLPDYEDFVFANGEVKEETLRRTNYELAGEHQAAPAQPAVRSSELILDKAGSARTRLSDLPHASRPNEILTELEFRDPGGETQTVSTRTPLWPSGLLLGIKPDSWASSKEAFRFHVIALDLSGRPVTGSDIKVELFERKYYSHRKRLVGGFYSYEHVTATKRVGPLCEGKTDERGLLICEVQSPVSGNVIVQARSSDKDGNLSTAHRDVWIAGKGEWWFDVADNDRIDLLPEKKRYEPGETAKLQVRMPFREATALIAVEREGVMETYVRKLSGKDPVIEIPVKDNYAPNVFVSALIVRGRVSGIQPTALVDWANRPSSSGSRRSGSAGRRTN